MSINVQRPLQVEWMGTIAYADMLALQEKRHAEVSKGLSPDSLFLLEHEPVITEGKNAKSSHVLVSSQDLLERGVARVATNRGGDVTYHGPGQLVGYPIIALQDPQERDIRKYVHTLEELMIRTASRYGVEARRIEGIRGIWVGQEKIGAVGVRIARWVTMHGFALNVSTHLDDFSLIVPCGLRQHGVTSLEKVLGKSIDLLEVRDTLIDRAAALFNRKLVDLLKTPAYPGDPRA
jgi:lipoyl(octanoyl) transferase